MNNIISTAFTAAEMVVPRIIAAIGMTWAVLATLIAGGAPASSPPSPQQLAERFGGWSRVPPQAWVRRRGARR